MNSGSTGATALTSEETKLIGYGKQILAIDDAPANLEPLVVMLEMQGYKVNVALNGLRGIKIAHLLQPDAILLDIAMPGMNGLEVCRQLKSDPETEHIPVIFVTAGSDRLAEAYELGAADCLLRPVNEAHLLARVRHSIRLRELAEAKIEMVTVEQGERFRALVDTVPDGIITIGEDCLVKTLNPAAEKMFGYAGHEIVGKNVNVLMPEPYQHEHDQYVGNYLKSGQPRIIGKGREVAGKRKDGSEFPMELAVGEFFMEGERMFAGIIRDISERKQAQKDKDSLNQKLQHELREKELALARLHATQNQMVQTEKMAALGSLVAGVAHEINTPVGISVTAASVLENACKELIGEQDPRVPDEEAIRKFTRTASETSHLILSNLQRAANLISSFKLIAVDQASDQKREFLLNQYVQEILENVKPKLRQHKIDLVVDIPDSIEMNSYPGALAIIITNLVMNSLTHGFEEKIEKPQIKIICRCQDDHIVLAYSDNGKGMPEAVRDKAFDPFFTTRRGKGGSGLGLHMVYNLVTQSLNGSVSIESQEGQGASFTFHLPLDANNPP